MASDADVPAPPWRTPRRKAQPRPQLSQELIVETGLAVLDAEGLDGLSMRRVAQELGTGPASLYAHVSGKEELLELIYDRVLGEIRLPAPDPARWREQLRAYAEETHRVLARHADVARAALAGIPTGPNAVRLAEYVFGLLVEAGMPPREASLALDRLTLYISGDAFEGSLHYARMRAAEQSGTEEYFRHYVSQVADYFRSLPPERFPYISRHVDALIADGGEARFRYGLDLLLAGLAARMPDAAAKP
ncbi:TetR/AcrR family transcriptional regulator [Nonomuraea muscovyensis]|uniref:AcrR family transcriptional regulator n=1 Tax=Nonomuraea muscovyensis TaxID=1124761 RepID=A0A7X0C5L7_9ACTN|nr:TetR/AcrR family transcriptional regulator C-terminal domain-containing protein [Nonomuraea muscovyensis]MBB6348958.1 AcrR family transcriptional regulator [Nonomuraea muscovyensis]